MARVIYSWTEKLSLEASAGGQLQEFSKFEGAKRDNRINGIFKKIDENTQGIAIAIAMGGLTLPANKNMAVSVNGGFYEGKQAVAAQTAIKLTDTFTLNGGVGFGVGGGSQVGGRVGISAAW